MSAAQLTPCWHRMGWANWMAPGLQFYVQDDFGTLVKLTEEAWCHQNHYTVGQGSLIDEAEAAFQAAYFQVADAHEALRKAQAELLAALPPKVAQ